MQEPLLPDLRTEVATGQRFVVYYGLSGEQGTRLVYLMMDFDATAPASPSAVKAPPPVTKPSPPVDSPQLVRADEISGMIKTVMASHESEVTACYAAHHTVEDDQGGGWRLKFVVRTDGSTGSVAVTPERKGNPAIESCIAAAVTAWRFSRIPQDQPMELTNVLGP